MKSKSSCVFFFFSSPADKDNKESVCVRGKREHFAAGRLQVAKVWLQKCVSLCLGFQCGSSGRTEGRAPGGECEGHLEKQKFLQLLQRSNS